MTQIVRVYNIEGKDYLDQWESAHYMCLSLPKFRRLVQDENIRSLNNHGKIVYRKSDLAKIVEKQNK